TGLGTAAIAGAILALERGGGAARWRLAAGALGAGLAAFAFQAIVCPVASLEHVALAHASAGIGLAAAAVLGRTLIPGNTTADS
ncbi:MAG: hypothetical protein ABMB14_15695, partial [Myxococcota bacterium]